MFRKFLPIAFVQIERTKLSRKVLYHFAMLAIVNEILIVKDILMSKRTPGTRGVGIVWQGHRSSHDMETRLPSYSHQRAYALVLLGRMDPLFGYF